MTASARTQTITYTGDVTATLVQSALYNPASPGVNELKSLITGVNTITVPTGGATARAVTIIPPAGNTVILTLKGVEFDMGVQLHPTDPATISLGPTVATFVLNASNAVTGLRLIWS
jgi:hypothetical protein